MTSDEAAKNFRYLPLAHIFVDFDWNSRSKANVYSDVSDGAYDTTSRGAHLGEGEGLAGLADSLAENGQDVAVIVSPVKNRRSFAGYVTELPFELVCGFRRKSAAEMLAASGRHIKNLPEGTIRAEIRELSSEEALLLNARENIERSSLDTPDLVSYVARLRAGGISQNKIAKLLKLSAPYASILARVSQLPAQVLAHWREGKGFAPRGIARKLTTQELLQLFEATKGQSELEVLSKYEEMLAPAAEPTTVEKDVVGKRLDKLGELLGQLVLFDVLREGSLDWHRVAGPKSEGFPVDTGRASAKVRAEYWDRLKTAFEKGKNS